MDGTMKHFLIVAVALLYGCSEANDNARKLDLSSVNGLVDLQKEVGGNWERVCIFGPYSTNSVAAGVLGFEWDLELKSSVFTSDDISLLVFTASDKVVSFFEVSRGDADFSELSRQCFRPSDSKFRIHRSQSGWPEVEKA
ncbi:MAG: hypothetical protein HLX50_17355 [Alteromonadaceae bacterium]|nr:hypothetical protein [Alteromonadaceae bacterium]